MTKSKKTNILTIDVEDWYMDTDISTWDQYEDRIVQSTNKILRLLSETNSIATFFVLGYVAERFPKLVEDIKKGGHEVATHGYSHTPIINMTPKQFEEDLVKSIKILESITNEKIKGHRACNFTIVKKTSWAIDILKKHGIEYDSSIFPVKTHLYGVEDAPLFPYKISSLNITKNHNKGNLLELPLSVYKAPIIKKNIPIAGGFYLRSFPPQFINYAINKINRKMFVFIDPDMISFILRNLILL